MTFSDTYQGTTTTLATVTLGTNGQAAFTPTYTLPAGTHTITATYSGDANNPAGSATLSQIVTGPPTVLGSHGKRRQHLNSGQISEVTQLEVTFSTPVAITRGFT